MHHILNFSFKYLIKEQRKWYLILTCQGWIHKLWFPYNDNKFWFNYIHIKENSCYDFFVGLKQINTIKIE